MSLTARDFKAEGYRSLMRVAYPFSDLDVFVGANGVGKSNLYGALELLRSAAANTLAGDLVRQGGLQSALWAGQRRGQPELTLAVGLEHGATVYRYEVVVGFPQRVTAAAFENEPQIKTESLSLVTRARTVRLLDRKGASVMARDGDGRPADLDIDLLPSETVLGRLEDPSRYPELDAVRRTLLQWRFYHGLRTDADSPLRRPCPAVATPTLASDGADLAAVFATLAHIRQDTADLDEAVDRAFPGACLHIPAPGRWASFGLTYPDFPQRLFEAAELSDGTLQFLGLAGALLSYRLPPFIALNEPEASLHPDLMEPLASLIVRAARRSQVWLVTHSRELADAVAASGAGKVRTVLKRGGATQIEGLTRFGAFNDDEDEED
ncbi:AAA family ATPase [Caulobacter sp. 602-2]|uniref:AAA family ATPase n=1 Tax=Caulobacter sp. 602-2 TaxID=2710887 RepID=A0A6G4QUA9_9CAUL|nr:AAA family ATPase [Caulobacter sp. 602-2]NGM49073.1 AAA family ATPase [Caulobacter sp. 602-2]